MLRRISFLTLFAILFSVLPGGAAPAYAQNEHAGHYKAYNEALDSGDLPAAADHAQAAWRAAEREMGDNQTTAILAYNFANLIYYSRPADAIAPLNRVIALTGEGHEIFGAEAPVVMLAYVEASADEKSLGKKKALRRILEEKEAAGAPPNLLAARAWLHIAYDEMRRKKYERAEKSTAFAIRHYRDFQPSMPREAAGALITGGVARVAGRSRNNTDLIEAAQFFDEATGLFPPQVSIETFDPLLAAAIAWQAATWSAAQSDNSGGSGIGSRVIKKAPDLDRTSNVTWDPPKPEGGCVLDWEKRDLPSFPESDLNKGYLGAVLVGFHIDGLRISGGRMLAEVPERSRFGEVALEATADWTLKQEPGPECRSNHLSVVLFIIK